MRSAIRLTGQIRLNEDNLAHIVPLTSGIVRKVNKSIGDKVAKDEILAWIESSELGQAKIEYLEIMAEIGCCAMLLPRAQLIHDNSLELIEMLKKRPALDELRKIDGMEMGLNRSILVKAYAEYVLAKSAYEREKSLFDEKITSREELLKTENLLKKTEAEFVAFLDTTTFEVKQALMEAQRDQNSQEILLKGAERTLYVLGLREEDIAVLAGLGQNQTEDGEQKVECSDPNCEDCKKKAELAKLAKDAKADFTKLGWYPLRAPFDGIVIDKHITIGERLGEDSAAFTIADMNTVWIDLDIFAKDMFTVSKGQAVTISLGDLTGKAEISFVSPLLDVKTRTATARIILDNKSGMFRPGSFVTAEIDGKSYTASVVVAKDAVQTMENRKCVFIKDSDGYEPRFVTVGRSD
ncbi:MAG: efflux RND transporter periplasmic adaptor subunit, partial [Anaerohalosphaera sp.]|nr:efflux RND transporter periplasmic adaptor subunit [Anaerohalosphaera sp.]